MNNAVTALSFMLAAFVFSAYPADTISGAPLNPDFIAWKNSNAAQKGMEAMATVNGHGLGYIPSPAGWSHLASEQVNTGLMQAAALPASLDLRGTCMTSVKNQGQCGSCWAFGTYGAMESWLFKIKGESTWDFSEQNLITTSGFDYTCCQGGNYWMSAAYLSRWSGPVNESDDPYGEATSTDCTPHYGFAAQKYLDSMMIFSTSTDIKNALMTYGALNTTMYMDESASYYNSTTYCYYYPHVVTANHSVTIAGWDDSKVVAGAPQAGAWLIKNSWGSAWGDQGYFWVSYSDSVACKQAVAFSGVVPVSTFGSNYYYDTLGCVGQWGYGSTSAWAANIFTAAKNEYLTAVGFYAVSNNASYTISIYSTFSNNTFSNLLETTTGTLTFAGYYTIPLPTQLSLTNGSRFCIVVKFTTPGYNYPIPAELAVAGYSSKAISHAGRSYISSNGVTFSDFNASSGIVCIRGLTRASAPTAPSLITPTNGAVGQAVSPALSWGTSALATSYEVQVSLSSTFGTTVFDQSSATLTSATASGLANGTTYYWRANASNSGGTAWSNAWSFTTIVAAPVAPVLASPTNGAAGQTTSPVLSWSTSARATSYEVQVSLSSTFGATVFDQSGLTVTSRTTSGLANGKTYYWRANASNSGGTGLWSSVWNFSTLTLRVIPVAAGWNMKSLNIHPTDSTVAGIFSTRTGTKTDPKGFLMVKDVSGTAYMPSLGINTIGTFITGRGYQIYTDSTDTMRVTGTPVAVASTPISLPSTNWSIIAFLPQTNMATVSALAGIAAQLVLIKDNLGNSYMPGLFNNLDSLRIGEGYYVYTKAAATLTYPSGASKRLTDGKPLLSLPEPRHYAKHRNTGNNATVVAMHVDLGGSIASDNCEVGAFDAGGNLVGAGTVMNGLAAITIWGDDPQTKGKDGCDTAEKVTFKLWNKTEEYPVEWKAADGGEVRYAAQGIFIGNLAVPAGATIRAFNLERAYPNPFRGFVRVAFDVPTINGVAAHDIEINVFNLKGILVHQLVKGKYNAGHYEVTWNGESEGNAMLGSSVYMIQMKANGFDKRLKLFRIR